MATTAYVGKGTVYLQDKSAAGKPLYAIGNCSKVTDAIETESKEMPDYENAGGGTAAKFSRIKAVKTSIEMLSFAPENIALALRGSVTANAGAVAIVGEAATVPALGSLIPLARLGDLTVAPVVKKGLTVISAATNYEWRRGGLYIIPGAADLVAGDAITVDYTPLPDDLIQCLVASAVDYRIVIDGLNEAVSGKAVRIEKYRCQFDPAQSVDWIGDEFGKLALTATQLADTTITTTGLSQYQTVRKAR